MLQGNTLKFATESTALGITIDNKLNPRAQFEKCSRKAENAMGVLEPLVQNQFITPSTILKLMNCVVIPVWTYLSHIWANPTAFRTSSLWYKILSKSSNTKYKHELTKMDARRFTTRQLFEATGFNGSSERQCGLCSGNCERQRCVRRNLLHIINFLNLYIIAAFL